MATMTGLGPVELSRMRGRLVDFAEEIRRVAVLASGGSGGAVVEAEPIGTT